MCFLFPVQIQSTMLIALAFLYLRMDESLMEIAPDLLFQQLEQRLKLRETCIVFLKLATAITTMHDP